MYSTKEQLGMIKIVIADDHQLVIDGIKALLMNVDGVKIVGEALNGQLLMDLLAKTTDLPEIVIMDINMPGLDGIATARLMKQKFPSIGILVLSMYDKPMFIKNLIEVGVSGYVLKNSGRTELLNAIHNIADGQTYFSAEVTKSIMNSFRSGGDVQTPLTKREVEIIQLIAKSLTTNEIADKLFISTHTVDTHRKNILSKLNLKNTAAIVNYAIKNGLMEDGF